MDMLELFVYNRIYWVSLLSEVCVYFDSPKN